MAMQHRSFDGVGREAIEEADHRIVAALLAGGDSRLSLDQQGANKYACPPTPEPALACLSSCTASSISEVGFKRAAEAYQRIAEAPSKMMEANRIEYCQLVASELVVEIC